MSHRLRFNYKTLYHQLCENIPTIRPPRTIDTRNYAPRLSSSAGKVDVDGINNYKLSEFERGLTEPLSLLIADSEHIDQTNPSSYHPYVQVLTSLILFRYQSRITTLTSLDENSHFDTFVDCLYKDLLYCVSTLKENDKMLTSIQRIFSLLSLCIRHVEIPWLRQLMQPYTSASILSLLTCWSESLLKANPRSSSLHPLAEQFNSFTSTVFTPLISTLSDQNANMSHFYQCFLEPLSNVLNKLFVVFQEAKATTRDPTSYSMGELLISLLKLLVALTSQETTGRAPAFLLSLITTTVPESYTGDYTDSTTSIKSFSKSSSKNSSSSTSESPDQDDSSDEKSDIDFSTVDAKQPLPSAPFSNILDLSSLLSFNHSVSDSTSYNSPDLVESVRSFSFEGPSFTKLSTVRVPLVHALLIAAQTVPLSRRRLAMSLASQLLCNCAFFVRSAQNSNTPTESSQQSDPFNYYTTVNEIVIAQAFNPRLLLPIVCSPSMLDNYRLNRFDRATVIPEEQKLSPVRQFASSHEEALLFALTLPWTLPPMVADFSPLTHCTDTRFTADLSRNSVYIPTLTSSYLDLVDMYRRNVIITHSSIVAFLYGDFLENVRRQTNTDDDPSEFKMQGANIRSVVSVVNIVSAIPNQRRRLDGQLVPLEVTLHGQSLPFYQDRNFSLDSPSNVAMLVSHKNETITSIQCVSLITNWQEFFQTSEVPTREQHAIYRAKRIDRDPDEAPHDREATCSVTIFVPQQQYELMQQKGEAFDPDCSLYLAVLHGSFRVSYETLQTNLLFHKSTFIAQTRFSRQIIATAAFPDYINTLALGKGQLSDIEQAQHELPKELLHIDETHSEFPYQLYNRLSPENKRSLASRLIPKVVLPLEVVTSVPLIASVEWESLVPQISQYLCRIPSMHPSDATAVIISLLASLPSTTRAYILAHLLTVLLHQIGIEYTALLITPDIKDDAPTNAAQTLDFDAIIPFITSTMRMEFRTANRVLDTETTVPNSKTLNQLADFFQPSVYIFPNRVALNYLEIYPSYRTHYLQPIHFKETVSYDFQILILSPRTTILSMKLLL